MKKEALIVKIDQKAKLPEKALVGDAGYDLFSNECTEIEPGKIKIVGTGIRMALPKGIEAQIRPKSGLAMNYGITVLNTPGTIDPNYRGEIKVILINLGEKKVKIERGQKIAQIVFNKFEMLKLRETNALKNTERGEKGFGSTGLR
ncbi:MAG: dUTP diphosphatase [Candidatus Diapherotrites archaeon]|nr:dUTP diphosphatase [Candidatus Diapherotrites archaeon]